MPASAQAPKSLLLRAMADAQRSIATAPARVLPEPETKRPPLFTKRFRDQQGPEMMERFAITLPNVQASEAQAEEEENMEDQSDTLQLMEEPDEAYVPELVAAAPSSLPVDVIYSPSPIVRTTSTSNEAKEMPRANTPEFLVTLDGYRGYDYTMNYVEGDSGHMEEEMENYESQMPEEEEEEAMEETEKYQDQEEQEQDSQKPRRQKIVFNSERLSTEDTETDSSKKMLLKSLDRCRFWPACRQGDACTFHHPTQPCKNLATIVAAPIAVLGRPVSQRIGGGLTCRFYPNCSNTNCRFFHPKSIGIPCRYGRLCSKPDCSFTHSEIPPKEKMKWVSTVR
ncbi:hypothetical protein B566_EDAN001885 [Ephemera danica]|nr:hypothetical protein B566_EDAN001885 [Ephemera danica]